MNHPLRAECINQEEQISTILSEQVLVPITCNHCKMDTDVSLAMLKQAQPFLCEHCYQVNRLSDAELQVLLNVLGRFGYRTSR